MVPDFLNNAELVVSEVKKRGASENEHLLADAVTALVEYIRYCEAMAAEEMTE